jgi:hypothetical protein
MRGDIEVHVKSSDWLSHEHHHDPAYNRVVLHVVGWRDTAATNLQNGKNVPIIAMARYLSSPISPSPDLSCLPAISALPCRSGKGQPASGVVADVLDIAGEQRFLVKVGQFQADLARMEADQCLYRGIMGALGYSRNKSAFLELADRLPLQLLESITKGRISEAECIARQQALLMGTAGLLPSQRPDYLHKYEPDDAWVEWLERLWACGYQPRPMSESDWQLFRVRPINYPMRRIAAMSHLVFGYARRGLCEEILGMVKEVPLNRGHQQLVQGLVVTADGYWASHFDFGSQSRLNSVTLLGGLRAADIAVNVILPFTFAWSRVTGCPELTGRAFGLYCRYPRLAANTMERHMAGQLGLDSSLINSACRQQGLIHIYKTFCTQGRCDICRLSHLETGSYIQI